MSIKRKGRLIHPIVLLLTLNLNQDQYEAASEKLINTNLGKDTFHETKHIFIQVPFDDDHSALIVISPVDKVVDILDSEPVMGRREDALIRVFKLLAVHLGQNFDLGQWLMRKMEVSLRQHHNANDCAISTLANAMCVAFSYPLDYAGNDTKRMKNKRRKIALELHHGGFDRYDSNDSDTKGLFVYNFGNFDIMHNPHPYGFYSLCQSVVDQLPEHV